MNRRAFVKSVLGFAAAIVIPKRLHAQKTNAEPKARVEFIINHCDENDKKVVYALGVFLTEDKKRNHKMLKSLAFSAQRTIESMAYGVYGTNDDKNLYGFTTNGDWKAYHQRHRA